MVYLTRIIQALLFALLSGFIISVCRQRLRREDVITDAGLLAELAVRKALIVHCSRTGKGDEAIGSLLFPDDPRNAIKICADKGKELCCSVIWPDHIEIFGDVGIILKPRSIKSTTLICTIDGGTYHNPKTCRREGKGVAFSKRGMMDTFAKATGYNEWNVQDAETIGIFVHPTKPLEVARRMSFRDMLGYDPSMGDEEGIGVRITVADIAAMFPDLPIYTFWGQDIVRVETPRLVPVNASKVYS